MHMRTYAHVYNTYICGVDGQRRYPRSDDFLIRDKYICVHMYMYTLYTYIVSMGNGGTLARMIFRLVTSLYAYICIIYMDGVDGQR